MTAVCEPRRRFRAAQPHTLSTAPFGTALALLTPISPRTVGLYYADRPERRPLVRDTGSLLEDYSVVCEAAARVGGSREALAEGGLEVARVGEDGYEVRHKGVLVFRCLRGRPPEVYMPGEWAVRLVRAADSGQAES